MVQETPFLSWWRLVCPSLSIGYARMVFEAVEGRVYGAVGGGLP